MAENMQSAELAEIWSLFAQEGRENLALAEEALLKLEPDPADAEQVKVLFRAIHSFKGGARMMGLQVVESLAHRAEDLIALVRDEGVALESEMIDLHLAVLDRLRAMLDRVLAEGHDVDPDQAAGLIDELQQMIARSRAAAVSKAPQDSDTPAETIAEIARVEESANPPAGMTGDTERVLEPAVAPAGQVEPGDSARAAGSPDMPTETTGENAPAAANVSTAANGGITPVAESAIASAETAGEPGSPATAAADGSPRLAASPDSHALAEFLKKTESDLALLHAALDALATGTPDALAQIQAVGNDLKSAAAGMAYQRLVSILDDLDRETRAEVSPSDTEERLLRLKKIELEIFEELTRIEDQGAPAEPAEGSSWTDIAWLFRHWNAERVYADLARLSEITDALDLLTKQFTVETMVFRQSETLAEEAMVLLKAIYHSCIFYHLDQAVHLSLALADIYGRIAQGELIVNDALTRLTRVYVTNLGGAIDAIRDGEPAPLEEFAKLIEQAQSFLYLHTDGPVFQVTRSVLDVLNLPADFKEVMTPETMAKFSRSLQAGERFYTVLADLERDEALGAAFLEWSSSEGIHLITNVTVYRYDRTLFNFLLATPQSRPEILAALVKMDPHWKYLTLEGCTLREQVDLQTAREEKPAEGIEAEANGVLRSGAGVSTQLIESINETLSTLVADHATLQRVVSRLADKDLVETVLRVTAQANGDSGRMRREVEDNLREWLEGINTLNQVESQVTAALGQLQEATRSLRLASVSEMLTPLRRMARELAQQQGKLVELELQGTELAMDRGAIETLEELVRRLVWYAVTQGIEDVESRRAAGKATAGHVVVKVSKGEDHARVLVEDDGRGLDRESIRQRARKLGWANGNDAAASQVDFVLRSGYGAIGGGEGIEGIDLSAIGEQLRKRHGRLSVQSEEGKGTRFEIRLPLDMAVVDGMVVRVGKVRYIVPVNAIRRIVKPEAADLVHSSAEGSRSLLRFDEQIIEIRPLSGQEDLREYQLLMVLEVKEERVALPIDELMGRQQVLVRPLQGQLADVPDVSGCALLGEGEVGMVLDLARNLNHTDTRRS